MGTRCRQYSIYNATVEEFTSILKLAHLWGFAEVKKFAVRELQKKDGTELDAISRIALYNEYGVDRYNLSAAYLALVMRPEPLTYDEGEALGLETVMGITHARELARWLNDVPAPLTVGGPRLEEMVRAMIAGFTRSRS